MTASISGEVKGLNIQYYPLITAPSISYIMLYLPLITFYLNLVFNI